MISTPFKTTLWSQLSVVPISRSPSTVFHASSFFIPCSSRSQVQPSNLSFIRPFLRHPLRLDFLGLQNHCRWWLQSCRYKMLSPWKKSYDKPREHIKKQRHDFANKGPSHQGYGFSSGHVWLCESWTIKKAECWRIDAFELWYWRRLLRVPWTAKRSNQSILKEISPECSLEGLMLKLKLQYFGHLIWRTYSLETILMLGKIEGRRRRGQHRMRWLDGIVDSMDVGLGGLW